ncbi:unnamed protein product [Diabrotica balteata]|uniref:Poly [ADP-ribose] polymerase n=1 Tax=Diabrotica balteata TaxID=107213 RepID=A0A9N9XJN0_DIABA|nr:unnamed protein product [Diabrotica balteata]
MGNLCCCFSKTSYEKVDPETAIIPCDNAGFSNSDENPITSTNDPIFTIETELRRSSSRKSNRTQIDNNRRIPSPETSTSVENENATEFKRSSSVNSNSNRLDGFKTESNVSINKVKRDMDTLRISYASSKQAHRIIQPKREQEILEEVSSSKHKNDNLSEEKRKISNAELLHHRSHTVLQSFRNLVISQTSTGTKVVQDNNLLNEIYQAYSSRTLTKLMDNQNVYNLEILNELSNEFKTVKRLFFSTNKKFFRVHNIERVHNPYLLMQYELKKLEYVKRGISLEEKLLFHGTQKSNIDGICQENFNWRLKGSYKGYIFGQGVSFSPIAYYSTHYGDNTYNKVMILASVLVANCCIGSANMKIPPFGYDTSVKENYHVYVKYDDNTYYPRYLIHYGGNDYKQH